MSLFRSNNSNEEHNFWQNYTDLFAGLLIVFIIASLIAYKSYKEKEEALEGIVNIVGGDSTGGLTGEQVDMIKTLVANHELYEKVRAFDEAKASLSGTYIKYDTIFKRFEITVDFLFEPNRAEIPQDKKDDLISAGQELFKILSDHKGTNIRYIVIIDGRVAKPFNLKSPTAKQHNYADTLSYERARQLFNLWSDNDIINKIQSCNAEVYVSGSGYRGEGRHTAKTDSGSYEDLNKRFVIQIIPYIKFD